MNDRHQDEKQLLLVTRRFRVESVRGNHAGRGKQATRGHPACRFRGHCAGRGRRAMSA